MKYAVHLHHNAWQRVEVEADNEEEAKNKAFMLCLLPPQAPLILRLASATFDRTGQGLGLLVDC